MTNRLDKLIGHRATLNSLLFTLFLLVQGCGFHLRSEGGSAAIPALAVSGTASGFLIRLKDELKHTGIEISLSDEKAVWVLAIHGSHRERRVMSVDEDGKAQEFELRQTVKFSVVDNRSKKVKTRQQFSRSRDLLFDKREVLAKSYEESLLYKDIEQDIINAIIWRLQALALED